MCITAKRFLVRVHHQARTRFFLGGQLLGESDSPKSGLCVVGETYETQTREIGVPISLVWVSYEGHFIYRSVGSPSFFHAIIPPSTFNELVIPCVCKKSTAVALRAPERQITYISFFPFKSST